MPIPMKTKTFVLSEHSAMLVQYALEQHLKTAARQLALIQDAFGRELSVEERNELPKPLINATLEEIQEQEMSWISLVNQIEGWIKDFTPENW